MTVVVDAVDERGPFVRDGWGRPLIPDPDGTGEARPYMRISSFAGLLDPPSLQDYHIGWGIRAALLLPDLAARWALADSIGQDREHSAASLADMAGMNLKRDKGTQRHRMVQAVLTGGDLPTLTRAQTKELQRVADAVRSLGQVRAVEQPLVCDEWRVAGTADYVGVGEQDGQPWVADLKTGERHRYSLHSWAVQVVAYARSVTWVDGERGELIAPTAPRLYIIHAPQSDPSTVDVIEVDPAAAKNLAERAHIIAQARDGWRQDNPLLSDWSAA